MTVAPSQLSAIAQQGFEVTGQRPVKGGVELDLVMDRAQADKLEAQGLGVELTRVKGGQTVRQFAAEQAAGGFTVWRSYDEAGGIRDQLYAAARTNPQLVKLEVLGHTGQGREIIAVKLTQGASEVPDGARPAVLYSSTQHAREWISTEVNRRLMNHYIGRWRANDREVRKLLQTTELWFILVANPDGYQYTFDHERLWRKNLRDNNGDGATQVGDGVDPNRNFPNHWGYDEEGSSAIQSSDTYRGPAPMSEPETQAMVGLLDRIGFAFQVNWHSAGQWLLYAEGWQTSTPTADDPIYYAMSGNLDDPAIDEFHPGLSSDVLYVTNGETTDYAHAVTGALAWTPELSEGCDGCGFVFPDDPALVQAEFQRNLPFAHSVARSAVDPDDPKTVTGIQTKPFYVDSDDPYKSSNPGVQLSFTRSYGDPQPVAVIAKRSLGAVEVKYSINGEDPLSAPMSEWDGGSTYNPASVYYHQLRGEVTGTDPGDSVEVWFEGGGQRSESFTYEAVSESGNDVLVVAAEDYTGASPVQASGPQYVDTYIDALAANGQQADVYDIDAAGRTAPDALGVLSHYDAVVWETGNDLVTRTAGRGGGNADRLAVDELLEFRSYLNEGGKVLLAGDSAGLQYTNAPLGDQMYDPKGEAICTVLGEPNPDLDPRRCLPLWGSFFGGDTTNDVLQYYLGGYVAVADDGHVDGAAFDSVGVDDPFTGLTWGLDDPIFARQQLPEVVVPCHQRHPAGRPVQAVRELAVGAVRQAGRAVRPAHRRAVRLLADRRRHLQEAHPRDLGAGGWRVDDLLDVVRHRGGVGPPVRGGPYARRRGLDDAAGRQRAHDDSARRQLLRGLGRAAPAPRPLPDVGRRRRVHRDRHQRRLERSERELGWLAGVEHRPLGIRRRDRRDLHRLRQRLGCPGHRSLRRRHHAPRRHQHLVRDRPGRLGDRRIPRGQRAQLQQLHPHGRHGLPRRQHDHHAALAADGVRTGGRLDRRRTQRGDGPGARPPAVGRAIPLQGSAGRPDAPTASSLSGRISEGSSR